MSREIRYWNETDNIQAAALDPWAPSIVAANVSRFSWIKPTAVLPHLLSLTVGASWRCVKSTSWESYNNCIQDISSRVPNALRVMQKHVTPSVWLHQMPQQALSCTLSLSVFSFSNQKLLNLYSCRMVLAKKMTLKTIIEVPVITAQLRKLKAEFWWSLRWWPSLRKISITPGKLVLIGCSMGFKIGHVGINILSYLFVLLWWETVLLRKRYRI